ncbi:serine/threonine-protein kinase HAL4/sat4 [Aspergillus alliaceus]|uniref:non-specific serine/threonine protein kinase n=1 Tax=Petromyces alliaceus TaxID=209559 RepID=A0A8H6E494_PETAA|nr:serine/threonine-protein kinase HAL4/sat4 [Aspergillus burnettii]
MGVAHRDLKPENLLLSSRGCLKISDFGNAECFRLAWENQVHMSSKRCDTGPYISPEQYSNEEFDPRPVDLWAAGIIYVVMRSGRRPWKIANDTDECFRDYLEDRRTQEQSHKVLYSMLDINPLRRPAAAEILTSDWVQEVVCCEAAVPGLHD